MWEELDQLQESADISTVDREHLLSMHLNLQTRINAVERTIIAFDFDDLYWSQVNVNPGVRAASDRFRKFLRQFYEKRYHCWPTKQKFDKTGWLDRRLRNEILDDFTCLYEYCVDGNVTLKNVEVNSNQQRGKAVVINANKEAPQLNPEDDEMLGVLSNFDLRNDNTPIPHRYPLLPEAMALPAEATRKSMFKNKKPGKARESRIADAYGFASNAPQVHQDFAQNALLEAFVRFEKLDQACAVDPREARRGRWIIIYCSLQAMASIAADIPQLTFQEKASYFGNARTATLPPWHHEGKIFAEGALQRNCCWSHSPPWIDIQEEGQDPQVSSIGSCGRNRSNSSSTAYSNTHENSLHLSGDSSTNIAESRQLSTESLYFCEFHRSRPHPASDSPSLRPGSDDSLLKSTSLPIRHSASIFTRFSPLKNRSMTPESSSLRSTVDPTN